MKKNNEPKIQSLVSVMNLKDIKDVKEFVKNANISENALLINQVDNEEEVFNYEDEKIKAYSFCEKGVTKSRNKALDNASGQICILADDDIQYEKNYKESILQAYTKNKNADMIIFYIESQNKERPAKKLKKGKLCWLDIMRASTSGVTFKLDKLKEKKVRFNSFFGQGSVISKGEETVFLNDCYRSGLKMYYVPIKIGSIKQQTSTWFKGYDEKFFFDQGAIFGRILPEFYKLLIIQYIIRKRFLYKNKFTMSNIYSLMKKGAKEAISNAK